MIDTFPYPVDIQVLQKPRCVAVIFSDQSQARLPFAYLRANSPSAEQKGHGPVAIKHPDQIVDSGVNITHIEPVGNYAVKLVFDDGHSSGLFTWPYWYELATQRQAKSPGEAN